MVNFCNTLEMLGFVSKKAMGINLEALNSIFICVQDKRIAPLQGLDLISPLPSQPPPTIPIVGAVVLHSVNLNDFHTHFSRNYCWFCISSVQLLVSNHKLLYLQSILQALIRHRWCYAAQCHHVGIWTVHAVLWS